MEQENDWRDRIPRFLKRPGVLLVLAVLAVYANCLGNGFIFDDEHFIQKNRYLASFSHLPELLTENIVAGAGMQSNLFRPAQSFTHLLDVQIWGLRPWGHHLTNVLIHVFGVLALYLLLRTLMPKWPAAAAAAVFGLHPMQAEVVAYISGRGDGMGMLFTCLGLLLFRRSVWLALPFAALAMASKESYVLFPGFLLLVEWARGRRAPEPKPSHGDDRAPGLPMRILRRALNPPWWTKHLLCWGLAIGYVILRATAFNFADTFNFYGGFENEITKSPGLRAGNYLTTIPKAFLLWIFPFDLHHERSWIFPKSFWTPDIILSGLLVLALLWLAGFLAVRALLKGNPLPAAAAGIFWFFGATLPTSNIFAIINALFYDHWFILPGIGLVWILGWAIRKGTSSDRRWIRRAVIAAWALFTIAIAAVTPLYNAVWRDGLTLYTHILFWEPGSAKAYHNLAMALEDRGEVDRAIELYNRALKIDGSFAQTWNNLGYIYYRSRRPDRALFYFERATAIDPSLYQAWKGMGSAHMAKEDPDNAIQSFSKAIDAFPYDAESYLGLSEAYLAKENRRGARFALQRGLEALPGHPRLLHALQRLR